MVLHAAEGIDNLLQADFGNGKMTRFFLVIAANDFGEGRLYILLLVEIFDHFRRQIFINKSIAFGMGNNDLAFCRGNPVEAQGFKVRLVDMKAAPDMVQAVYPAINTL